MDSLEYFLYNRLPVSLPKFKVVGLITSPHFQKCRYLILKLHQCFPKNYDKPEIRAMLNLDWDEFLTKMRRRHGKPFYLLQTPVAIFLDGTFFGDHEILTKHINERYRFETNLDFQEMGNQELINYFTDIMENKKRKLTYLTVAIDGRVVGSMLFLLYTDLVPITCENFLNRCQEGDYKGTKIHRLAKYSWVQCGGFDLKHHPQPCENYAVPHNRRGVLSMCNSRRHQDNSTQFFITLEATSWMDCNFVAFGQLIQGAEILKLIEKIDTYYQKPLHKIEIVNCGEFSLCPQPDNEYFKCLNPPFSTLFEEPAKIEDIDSVLSITGYKAGKYCLRTDLRPYLPFSRYSRMFDEYLQALARDFPYIEEEHIEETKPVKEVVSEPELDPFILLRSMKGSAGFCFRLRDQCSI